MPRQRDSAGQSVPALPPLDSNRRYPIPIASLYLSQSKAKTYQDMKAGRLKTIKDGKRNYVPGSEIIRRSTLPAQGAT